MPDMITELRAWRAELAERHRDAEAEVIEARQALAVAIPAAEDAEERRAAANAPFADLQRRNAPVAPAIVAKLRLYDAELEAARGAVAGARRRLAATEDALADLVLAIRQIDEAIETTAPATLRIAA